MIEGKYYKFGLTNAVTIDEEEDEGDYYAIDSMKNSVFKDYSYVMHGKVFRYELHEGDRISQYISFGGLIMMIRGDIKYLKSLEIDSQVFVMLNKNE